MRIMTMWKIFESKDMTSMLQAKSLETCKVTKDKATVSITTDSTHKKQTVSGFGASFTDSASYLLKGVLSESDYNEVMHKLFDTETGIGLTALRNTMGASDYARDFYTYQDQADQPFNLGVDYEYVIPTLKDALTLNPQLWIMASPWSVPGWMKDSNHVNGGKLLTKYYDHYAKYFVDYIEHMHVEGIPIKAVTLQNEPGYMPLHYPSMLMDAKQQVAVIVNHMKPHFEARGLQTKIIAYDHNWDHPEFPLYVLEHAKESVDGTAWHWYGGRPDAQTVVHEAYPMKETYFSEGSGGSWIPEFEPAFSNLMRTSIEIMRNYSKTLILWNIALNEENGPFVPGFGTSTCRGLVKVDESTKQYQLTLDYYGIGHFSKFVPQGSVQIDSNQTETLRVVAFERPDNRRVLVCFNDSWEDQHVAFVNEGIAITMKAKCAYTIIESL